MVKTKLKILLIEDDRIEVLKLKRALSCEIDNYIIDLCENGQEALESIGKLFPDFIILDLNMPDTNGVEFLRSLKQNKKYSHIPVVGLSTSDNDSDITECYRLGIAGYILKPLKYDDYEVKINTLIKYWSNNEFLPH